MISTENLGLSFGSNKLFAGVNIKFLPGNCYGLIGANGSGKSTFLKVLSGEITNYSGNLHISPGQRIATLNQNHFAYEDVEVLQVVLMGYPELYAVMQEKDVLYAKADFTEADGTRASELEALCAEMNGWEAESNAASLLAGLGIKTPLHNQLMRELTGSQKVKVLLAQALFGDPDILLLDEPTNHLDAAAIRWVENFLVNFNKTVIVVSHDRHFLNHVCTHMADIDFGNITLYTGNYDFWSESSQLALKLQQDQNKKLSEKAEELKAFIARFSANKSKSSQATSRRKQLEKLNLEDIKPSSRRYPFVCFKPEREAGDQLLRVQGLTKTIDGSKVLNNVTFTVHKKDRIVFVGANELANTTLFKILVGELEADSGSFTWGVTTSQSYFPKDNSAFFSDTSLNLVDWLRQYSKDKNDSFVRGFLGRMLFSGEEALKTVNVISGGERVRCMLARMMLSSANVLLLDGPTNHLDLESITALNNGLIAFPGTILFTSQDLQFNESISTRVIELTPTGLIDYGISYEEYLKTLGAVMS
ncbi:MAG: ABC transporter ATP-binding protein [Candidatus Riflebacteria bacterium HGW-Riflebacteria-2]|jgi:ATPase subunit of ABC transporter with duplicated ATPase domains|nr:MAG: ABC transporter ATP-binding protein [Candidatus Riflebacteria bacterium HGW-Riflebacteria-2]